MKDVRAKRKSLLQHYGPRKYGLWQIRGEDTSQGDYNSRPHYPLLDTVEGYYEDVIEYALGLQGFFTWGQGGYIDRLATTKIGPGGGKVDT